LRLSAELLTAERTDSSNELQAHGPANKNVVQSRGNDERRPDCLGCVMDYIVWITVE